MDTIYYVFSYGDPGASFFVANVLIKTSDVSFEEMMKEFATSLGAEYTGVRYQTPCTYYPDFKFVPEFSNRIFIGDIEDTLLERGYFSTISNNRFYVVVQSLEHIRKYGLYILPIDQSLCDLSAEFADDLGYKLKIDYREHVYLIDFQTVDEDSGQWRTAGNIRDFKNWLIESKQIQENEYCWVHMY